MRSKFLIFLCLLALNGCAELDIITKKINAISEKLKSKNSQNTNKPVEVAQELIEPVNSSPSEFSVQDLEQNESNKINDITQSLPLFNEPNLTDNSIVTTAAESIVFDTVDTTDNINESNLYEKSWKISKSSTLRSLVFEQDQWIFNFSKKGIYKALGVCNQVNGKFKATSDQSFRISKLESSNNKCIDGRNEEVIILNDLLLTNNYELSKNTLIFKYNEKELLEFKPINYEFRFTQKQKIIQKPTKKHTKKSKRKFKIDNISPKH